MNFVNETIVLAVFFAVALGLEWRYRLRSIRLGAASLALLVLFFAQPSPTRAARRAVAASPAERVTALRGSPLSAYESGVLTMAEFASEDASGGENARWLGLGVLFWLACSPAIRSDRTRAAEARLP